MHNAAVDTSGKGVGAPAASNNIDLLDLLGGIGDPSPVLSSNENSSGGGIILESGFGGGSNNVGLLDNSLFGGGGGLMNTNINAIGGGGAGTIAANNNHSSLIGGLLEDLSLSSGSPGEVSLEEKREDEEDLHNIIYSSQCP